MGIEPYLIAPALQLIIGQRLVRKACPHCGKWIDATAEENTEILKTIAKVQHFHPNFGQSYQGKVFHGMGCEVCNHTGYLGRIAILEILEISDELRNELMQSFHGENRLPLAEKSGFVSMQEDGILKVIQ